MVIFSLKTCNSSPRLGCTLLMTSVSFQDFVVIGIGSQLEKLAKALLR